jgi:hypothetical protein
MPQAVLFNVGQQICLVLFFISVFLLHQAGGVKVFLAGLSCACVLSV